MKRFTALVSAYYAEKYIHARLNNLDGVDTVVVCQRNSPEHKIAFEYPVKVVTTDDIPTIGKAWNMALEQAGGEFVFTANTDDLIYKEKLPYIASIFDQYDVGLVFGDVDVNVKGARWKRIHDPEGRLVNQFARVVRSCFIGPMPFWRRGLHSTVGLFDEGMIVACDYDMWVRFTRAGVDFYYLPESLGLYTRRADSLEHRNAEALALENKKIRWFE